VSARVSFDSQAAEPALFARRVKERARELGFDAVGIARADEPLDLDFERYREFLRGGMHGEMAYLVANEEVRRRVDSDEMLMGARSVIAVARVYQRPAEREADDPPTAKLVARYARGRDYHNFLKKRLRKLADFVRALAPDIEARALCDDAPILERAWAARAGLGFVGKNGMLIVPGSGSMLLLGEVITTLSLPADAPIAERCGSCTRCLDACPTRAFPKPFVLDARRCISYLTIEQRGPSDPSLREPVGDHLFGCDDCQTVCPFNRAASLTERARSTAPFEPLDRWATMDLEALLSIDEDTWGERFEGSPLKRAGRAGLARNAALVLGNRGDQRSVPALRAALAHDSSIVRDAAKWAIDKIVLGSG
jgi:epoxyqueuosine reductase